MAVNVNNLCQIFDNIDLLLLFYKTFPFKLAAAILLK